MSFLREVAPKLRIPPLQGKENSNIPKALGALCDGKQAFQDNFYKQLAPPTQTTWHQAICLFLHLQGFIALLGFPITTESPGGRGVLLPSTAV